MLLFIFFKVAVANTTIPKNLYCFLQIIDQGLGHLEKNAAEVFSKFENFTKTNTISSYVNMEASVEVLSILDGKLKTIDEENVVDVSIRIYGSTFYPTQ